MNSDIKIKWHNECEPKLNIHNKGELVYLTSPMLDKFDWIRHGVSTRLGGVSTGVCATMNLKNQAFDSLENIWTNYTLFCDAIGVDGKKVAIMEQVHENHVEIIDENHQFTYSTSGLDLHGTDGCVTNIPGVSLVANGADCQMILFADPVHRAIGACHAGWRGTVKQIVVEMIKTMENTYGSNASDMCVFFAPSICQECYEVSEDVIDEINKIIPEKSRSKVYYQNNNQRFQLSLWETNRYLLESCGVKSENIQNPNICTLCNNELLFSHRKMGNKRGTGASLICIK